MTKKFLTMEEAADYLGISEHELQNLAEKGRIPAYKIGGIYTRFKADELNLYRRKAPNRRRLKKSSCFIDNAKDFFYFNDFYVYSAVAIIVILYFIFK